MTENLPNADDRLYRTLFHIVFIGSILVYFWGIWAIPTLSHNEARRMVVVQEMLAHHNWLIPTLNGQIYLEKPPLFYWLAVLCSLLFQSTAEWVIRLPSALSAFGLTWLLYDRVKRYVNPWAGLFTALLLVTSIQFTMFARRAEIEMVLTACCAAALVFYFDYLKRPAGGRYLCLSYLFLALACLTKGPVALLFFVPPILTFALLKKDRQALKGLASARGWAIFAVIALPWYLYIYFTLEARMDKVIHRDVTYKAFSLENRDPFYEYLLVLLGAFVPWILIVFYRARKMVRVLLDRYENAFFACAFLAPLIIMSLLAAKHAKYILPLIPWLAVLLGIWFTEFAGELRVRWRDKFRFRSVLAVGVMVAGFFVYYAVVEARVYKYRFEAFQPLVATIEAAAEGRPVYMYKNLYYRVVYYYGKPMPVVEEPDVQAMLQKGEPFLLVADSRCWDELAGDRFSVVFEYRPFIKRDRAVRVLASRNVSPPS